MTSRRDFIAAVTGSLASAFAGNLRSAPASSPPPHLFRGPYGLQLYSLRKQLAKDVPGVLALVRQIGYTEVETAGLYGLSPQEFRGHLDRADLKCTSMHTAPERLRDALPETVKDAKTLGAEYVICGYASGAFQQGHPLGLENFRRAAGEFNEWGRTLRSWDLRLAYHNHDYEFRPVEGHPAFDTLLAETEPGRVDFEMDVFWVKRGGQDPVEYLREFPNRFRLVHLKDMVPGTPVGDFSVGTSEEASTALGKGILDFRIILREATKVGVERFYVEDESSMATEGIRTSLHYLKTVVF